MNVILRKWIACRTCLLGGEGLGYVFCAGAGLEEMLGDAGAFFRAKCGDNGEDAAQGYRYVVDVIHEADGFSGEGHLRQSSIKRILSSALLGGGADGGWLCAVKDGVRRAGAVIEDNQAEGRAHEDDGRPCGEAGEHVGGGARPEGGLRTLSAEGAGEICRAALLNEDDTDQEEAHDQVNNDDYIEENVHC